MTQKESDPSKASIFNILARRLVVPLGDRLFPTQLEHRGDGLPKAEMLLKNSYGIIIIIPHFSKRDPLEVLKDIVFKSPVMLERPIIAPIAFHQFDSKLEKAARLVGIELRPIVTTDTINKGKNKGHPLGFGLATYINDGIETLKKGGILLVAPQTGRREKLGSPEAPTMAVFVRQAERKKLDNYAFMFVGFGIKGETNYKLKKTRGLNIKRVYETRIGPTYTNDEILALLPLETLDEWVFSQLAQLVPAAYRGDI